MAKQRKTWQDNVKDAIYQLTNSASQLQGLNDYGDIQDDIITIRDNLKRKFNE